MNKIETTQYWDSFYKDNYLSDTSNFFKFVIDRVSLDYIVLDIGCGTARDTIAFTSKAAKVIGVDASNIVIEKNQENYTQLYSNLVFINLDISDAVQLDHLISSLKQSYADKKLFIYCRFFLHAISESDENVLFSILDKHLICNDIIALEFRTKEDEKLYKNYNDHYRRYIDSDKFDEKIKSYDFSTEFFVKSKGLSIYKDEDPYLARYIIKKERD